MTKAGLEQIVRALNEAGVRYLMVGDLAVAAHGAIPTWGSIEMQLAEESRPLPATMELLSDHHVAFTHYLAFESAYRSRVSLELAPGLIIPVCGYDDLVTSKRALRRSTDAVDLHHLEISRNEMMNPTLKKNDPWAACTFEGSELWALVEWAKLPFSEKVSQMEGMHALGMAFLDTRRRMGLRSILPSGEMVA